MKIVEALPAPPTSAESPNQAFYMAADVKKMAERVNAILIA